MWIIYGLPDRSVETRAFADGLVALDEPVRILNHNGYQDGPNQRERGASVVVVSGLRRNAAWILRDYSAIGVPVVVVDYGYLQRTSRMDNWLTGYWQVGLNRLGWVPDFECRGDRLAALDIQYSAKRQPGRAVYICGQHAGDPSHGLDSAAIERWARKRLSEVRNRPVVWRSHPDTDLEITGYERSVGPIDWDDVDKIVCINSNIGLEGLMRGKLVSAEPSAPYYALTKRRRTQRRLEAYLRRVAYAQWTIKEMEQGEPQKWLMKNGLMG